MLSVHYTFFFFFTWKWCVNILFDVLSSTTLTSLYDTDWGSHIASDRTPNVPHLYLYHLQWEHLGTEMLNFQSLSKGQFKFSLQVMKHLPAQGLLPQRAACEVYLHRTVHTLAC